MIDTGISHYRILEKIGEGGMGIVYRAEDTRLDRIVALKFISPSRISSKDARRRFIREAKAAAALDHQNICAIHEIEELDGKTFIVMAYCEGPSLQRRISEGPLPFGEAVNLARQIAEGLSCAHEKGIIHRDVNPSNIMIESEKKRVKITDFGLAAQVDSVSSMTTAKRAGTVAYVSPEQITDGMTDVRTDVWSLGVTFFEMLSGKKPFNGEYEASIIYRILNDEPRLPNLPDNPAGRLVKKILRKSMSKNPQARYQVMKDLAADLRRAEALIGDDDAVGGRPLPAWKVFVIGHSKFLSAVLFAILAIVLIAWFLSGRDNPREDYILPPGAHGDTDMSDADIIFEIGKSAYNGGDQTTGITLIEESVAVDPYHLEALKTLATYYNSSGDSRKAAEFIARAKKIAIESGGSIDLLKCNIVEAYVFHDWDMAVRNLESLLEQDPSDIRAHLNLGFVYSRYKADYDTAIEYFDKVLELDPDNKEKLAGACWNYIGNALLYSGRFDEAITAFKKYGELSPGSPDPVNSLATAYYFKGRYADASRLAKKMISAGKHSFKFLEVLGRSYIAMGKWQSAIEVLNRYIGAAPSKGYKAAGHEHLAQLYLSQMDREAFDGEIKSLVDLDQASIKSRYLQGLAALRFDGDIAGATACLEDIRKMMTDPFVFDGTQCFRHLSGLINSGSGRYDKAAEDLREALACSPREFYYFGKELVGALISGGKLAEAERKGQELLALNDCDYGLLMMMARLYWMKNDFASAQYYHERVMDVLRDSEPGFVPLDDFISKSVHNL